jgi:hypothetical protein
VFSSQLVFAHDLQVRIWLQQSGCEWEGAERTQAAVFAGFGGKGRSVPSLSHPFFVFNASDKNTYPLGLGCSRVIAGSFNGKPHAVADAGSLACGSPFKRICSLIKKLTIFSGCDSA